MSQNLGLNGWLASHRTFNKPFKSEAQGSRKDHWWWWWWWGGGGEISVQTSNIRNNPFQCKRYLHIQKWNKCITNQQLICGSDQQPTLNMYHIQLDGSIYMHALREFLMLKRKPATTWRSAELEEAWAISGILILFTTFHHYLGWEGRSISCASAVGSSWLILRWSTSGFLHVSSAQWTSVNHWCSWKEPSAFRIQPLEIMEMSMGSPRTSNWLDRSCKWVKVG